MELPATKRAYELTLAETLEIPSEDPSHLQGCSGVGGLANKKATKNDKLKGERTGQCPTVTLWGIYLGHLESNSSDQTTSWEFPQTVV